jgi:uncharacterized SAM-binding protein YcdF (DUF218 family)
MYEAAKVAGYLLSPLTWVLGLWLLAGMCLWSRRRRLALGLACAGFGALWIFSTPFVAHTLVAGLESAYPAMAIQATPSADAIVVLGGSVTGRHPPKRPTLALNGASSRVWYAAELYRAGKAKWVVVAAGGEREFADEQVEADAIAEMLGVLGVPRSALKLDAESRNTRENAANARLLLRELGVRRVLLVTSAQHMSRAVKTFRKVWANSHIEIIPAPTDVEITRRANSLILWIPSPNALIGVSKALKEYAGMAVLAYDMTVTN